MMNDLEQVAAAFDRKDYRTAAQLLKALYQQAPDHAWVKFYIGRLHEVSDRLDAAENAYRQILKDTINPKLALQTRQGLQRVENLRKDKRQEAIAQATADPKNTELGFLILEPIQGEARAIAVQHFARVMKLDAYTARIQLPSRGWQLYRTGTLGELQVYGQELQQGQVPVFWVGLSDIAKIRVFQVSHFQAIFPNVIAVCRDETGQLGSLIFNWPEVTRRVEGLVPIFEKVIDQGAWGKLERKEKTQDYAHLCDLHLPGRNCLLRLCDRHYQFQEGIAVSVEEDSLGRTRPTTTRIRWNHLLDLLDKQMANTQISNEFQGFAATTHDHREPLRHINPHLNLERPKETHWDQAFHLYSSLVFLKLSGT